MIKLTAVKLSIILVIIRINMYTKECIITNLRCYGGFILFILMMFLISWFILSCTGCSSQPLVAPMTVSDLMVEPPVFFCGTEPIPALRDSKEYLEFEKEYSIIDCNSYWVRMCYPSQFLFYYFWC